MNNIKIIDAHSHIGYTPNSYNTSTKEVLSYVERLGIESIFASSFEALTYKAEKGNIELLELAEKNLGKIYVYITINPHYVEGVEEYLDRFLELKSVIGIKLHPTIHNYPPDGDNYLKIYDYAHRKNILVLNHTFGNYKSIERIAKTYPGMKMIVGHGAAETDKHKIKYLAKNLRERDDIFFDTSSSSLLLGGLPYFVDLMGSKKVIFGTDVPFLDPAFQIGRIIYSKLNEKDKYMILRGNSERLLQDI